MYHFRFISNFLNKKIQSLYDFVDAVFLFFFNLQIKSSWSSSSVGCGQIRPAVMRRTSPSCLCAAGRETSCVVMTVQWSSPTCSKILQSLRGSRECRSCCHTVAGLKSCLPPSAQRRCTCILSLDECITPAQSAVGVSALSGQLWPLSSVPFLFMQRRASQDSQLTSSGEDRNTD